MDSDNLALLRSERKGIESLQGSGSKGDASCTTHGFSVTPGGREAWGGGPGGGTHAHTDGWKICPIVLYRTSEPLPNENDKNEDDNDDNDDNYERNKE